MTFLYKLIHKAGSTTNVHEVGLVLISHSQIQLLALVEYINSDHCETTQEGQSASRVAFRQLLI